MMKQTLKIMLTCLSVAGGAIMLTTNAPAATASLTFDANTSTTGAQDGSGTWDNTTANWWSPSVSSDVLWNSTSNAIFGAGADAAVDSYAINVPSSLTVSNLTFANTGYILSSGTAVNVTNLACFIPSVYVASGKTASIGTNATIYCSGGPFYFGFPAGNAVTADVAAGTLNIRNGGKVRMLSNSSFVLDGSGAVYNVFTGGTIAHEQSGGKIQLGSSVNAGATTTLNVQGGTVTSVGSPVSLYVGNSGNGTLNLEGGTVTLSAALNLGNASSGVAAINLDGGTLTLSSVTNGVGTGVFNFNGGTLKAAGAATNLLVNLTGAYVRNGGAIVDDGGYVITNAQALLHTTNTLDNAKDGGLTKNGTGTLTLLSANTYNGPTTISAGKLQIGSGGTLGSIAASGVITNNGILAFNHSDNLVQGTHFASAIIGNGSLVKSGAGTLTLTTANLTAAGGANSLTFSGSGSGTVVVQHAAALGAAGATVTFSGSGSGVLDIQLDTPMNPYILNSGNGNGGTVTIDRATPGTGFQQVLSNLTCSSVTMTFNKGNNITSGNAGVLLPSVQNYAGNNGNLVIAGSADITIGNAYISSGNFIKTLQLDGTSANNMVTGSISNGISTATNNVTKSNTGTWTLLGTNTYTGATTISAGKLQLGNGGTTGSIAASSAITNNATLAFNHSDNLVQGTDFAAPIVGTGSLIKSGAGTLTLTAANLVAAGGTNSLTFSGSGAGTVVVQNAAALGAAGATVNFSGNGSGVLDLQLDSAINAYNFSSGTGNGGTVIIDRATPGAGFQQVMGVLGSSSVTYNFNTGANIVSGNAGVSFAEVDLNGGNDNNPVTLAGSADISIGNAYISSSGISKRLQLDGTSANNLVTGSISNGISGGIVNLIKANSGTWTLSGNNTYTGTTKVSGGTLALAGTGSINNTPSIELASGVTLDVSALTTALTLGASQTLKADGIGANTTSTLALGAKGLTLSAGGLVFASYGAGSSTAPLTLSGSANLALNSSPVTVTTTTALAAGSYKLIATGGTATVTGTPGTLTLNGSGKASGTTASLQIISGELWLYVSQISSSGSLTAFSTTYGTASSSQNFSVSGSGLVGAPGNLTVTPPSGYEVSLSQNSGYQGAGNSLNVPYSSPTLAATTIYVRLAATDTAGSYAGNIQVSGGGAATVNVATTSSAASQGTPAIVGVAGQSISYGTATVGLSGSVIAGSAGYPGNGETVSITINGNTQSAAIAGGAGGFSLNYPTATIPPSSTPYTITYAYAGDANLNAAPNNTATTLTVTGCSAPNMTSNVAYGVSLRIKIADIQSACQSSQSSPAYTFASVATSTTGASVAKSPDNTMILYTPPTNNISSDTFSYAVSDGTATSPTATVTVNFGSMAGTTLSTPALDVNGHPVIKFFGIPGNSYHIQRSGSSGNAGSPGGPYTNVQAATLNNTDPFYSGGGAYTWTNTDVTVPPDTVFYRISYP